MSRYLYYKERKVNKNVFHFKEKKSVKYYRREIYVFVYLYDRLCVLKNVKYLEKFFCKKFFLNIFAFYAYAHTPIQLYFNIYLSDNILTFHIIQNQLPYQSLLL